MTIQEQIDQLKKEFDEKIIQIKNEVTLLTGFTGGNHQEVKPTRYYPNGAYMDEPELGTRYWYSTGDEVWETTFEKALNDHERLESQNCFPTKKACERDRRRKELTSRLYRDMRDERINGDWMADWESTENKCYPYLENRRSGLVMGSYSISYVKSPNPFYYKRDTFIEDLKAMGWTEEELKIVWFNN